MSRNVVLGAMAAGLIAAALTHRRQQAARADTIRAELSPGEFIVSGSTLDRLTAFDVGAAQARAEEAHEQALLAEVRALRAELVAIREDQREGFLGTLKAVPPLRRSGSARPA